MRCAGNEVGQKSSSIIYSKILQFYGKELQQKSYLLLKGRVYKNIFGLQDYTIELILVTLLPNLKMLLFVNFGNHHPE